MSTPKIRWGSLDIMIVLKYSCSPQDQCCHTILLYYVRYSSCFVCFFNFGFSNNTYKNSWIVLPVWMHRMPVVPLISLSPLCGVPLLSIGIEREEVLLRCETSLADQVFNISESKGMKMRMIGIETYRAMAVSAVATDLVRFRLLLQKRQLRIWW